MCALVPHKISHVAHVLRESRDFPVREWLANVPGFKAGHGCGKPHRSPCSIRHVLCLSSYSEQLRFPVPVLPTTSLSRIRRGALGYPQGIWFNVKQGFIGTPVVQRSGRRWSGVPGVFRLAPTKSFPIRVDFEEIRADEDRRRTDELKTWLCTDNADKDKAPLTLMQLPTEILFLVLDRLDARSLARLAATCAALFHATQAAVPDRDPLPRVRPARSTQLSTPRRHLRGAHPRAAQASVEEALRQRTPERGRASILK
jgi:hypothetical protein